MSEADEAATRRQETTEELNARKAELVEAVAILHAAKNSLRSALQEELAERNLEFDKADEEVARLRWEVAKAQKEAAKARGDIVDLNDLQKDIDVYRDAYRKRISGQVALCHSCLF